MKWFTRTRRNPDPVRYYVYVSDGKVEMLFSQISKPFLNRVAGELKVDLKILSISLTENPSEENRYARLRIVERYLNHNFAIGAVDDQTAYLRGALPMRWGVVGIPPTQVAFFWGIVGQTLIGLTGSVSHLTDSWGNSSVHVGSFTLKATEAVASALRLSEDETAALTRDPAGGVITGAELLHGPEEPIEFLARRLVDVSRPTRQLRRETGAGGPGPVLGTYDRVVLATPIYVAQSETYS